MIGPMLGAQRRIEARIGQLLGEAWTRSSSVTEVSKDDRSAFRLLARALDGECLNRLKARADELRGKS